jgi:hypothetical protein
MAGVARRSVSLSVFDRHFTSQTAGEKCLVRASVQQYVRLDYSPSPSAGVGRGMPPISAQFLLRFGDDET